MSIDKRIHYYLMLDSETAGGCATVEATQSFCYDIGFAVVDRHGNVYETYSYVNADVYVGMGGTMESAYFKNKLPQYEIDMYNGKRILATTDIIRHKIAEVVKKYNIKEVVAHNARFDATATNATVRYVTKSKQRYFMPYGLIWLDTLAMARDILYRKPSYISFCENNKFLTKNGKPQLKAEIIYKFITGDMDFEEKHTGLEDVLIEAKIFAYFMRQHKPMRKELYPKKEEYDFYGFPLDKVFPKKCKYPLDKLIQM